MNTEYADNHVPSDFNIFGNERDEVAGKWRKLHYEELYDPYCSPNIFRVHKSSKVRSAGNVARMGERRCAYRVLVGRHVEKRPLGRPRCRWEDNTEIDL
jgi:hypothetical protein